jgi:hypothetical protein
LRKYIIDGAATLLPCAKKQKGDRMLRVLTGVVMAASLVANPVLAQSTTSTVLSGEAYGFEVMDSTTPDTFSFSTRTNIEPDGIDVASNIITISGITEPVTASVSDLGTGGVPKISVNGALYTTAPVTVFDGDSLRVSLLPVAGVFSATYRAEVSIGDGTAIFQVTTRAADTTPDAFSFLAATNQEPGQVILSPSATISGLEAPAAVTVSGAAGSPQISVDGGATWGTSATVTESDTLAVRLTSGTFGDTRTATVNVGGVTADFSVTTRSSNENPVFAAFDPATGVEPSVTVTSAPVTVTGIETTVTASVSGDGLPEIQVNDDAWVAVGDTATVANNDTVRIRLSSGNFGETQVASLDINGTTGDFSVTTRAADTTPDAFAFSAVTGAEAGTSVQSGAVTISGIEAESVVTIAGDGSPTFSTDGGVTWTDTNGTGSVQPSDQIVVRLTSGTFDVTRTATLTVGGVTGDFSVTTKSQDGTPDPFAFATRLVAPGAVDVASESVILSGFDGSVAILVSGDASSEYRVGTDVAGTINWGSWTADAGTVAAAQLVQVRLDASASEGATRNATLSVGTGSALYAVTTQDLTPDAFAFSAVTGATLSATVTSEAVQIAGITGPVPISVTDGDGALFRVGTGPDAANITWGGEGFVDHTDTGLTVSSGEWVQVRLTASASYETEATASLTIGNRAPVSFSVTTGTEPVSITISSGAVPDGEEGVSYGGFDFTTVASVSGGSVSSPPTVNDLTWSVTGGALPAGMSLSAAGDLTGTPTEIGSFSFTARAALGAQNASASYTIIVNDPDGSFVIEAG